MGLLVGCDCNNLTYRLNTSEFVGHMQQIGDIVDSVNESLYKSNKLYFELYDASIEYEQANDTREDNRFDKRTILHESVLYRNLSDQEIAETIIRHSSDLDGINTDVIIIDPYLLNSKSKKYRELLFSILKALSATSIKLVIGNDYDEKLKDDLKRSFTNIEIQHSNKFHDRFWIFNKQKGFLLGTSLNGIGKKYSLLMALEKEDIDEICALVSTLND